ncbi:DUF72 domain-containing protein [Moorellaceae bacterium AZ2]
MGNLYLGTSGFNYYHWQSRFYPPELPRKEWLKFYALHFPTVELNVTFYRFPRQSTFINWYQQTPPHFIFALKGHRSITHFKRLQGVETELEKFFQHLSYLQDKLGIILWQFPPGFKVQREVLLSFFKLLQEHPIAQRARHAFEFRHNSWFNDHIFSLLSTFSFALCFADSPRWPRVYEVTADFVYLRFHGSQKLYSSSYSREELEEWAEKIKHWLGQGLDVYAYFNNDAQGYALANARDLLALLA